MAGPNINFADPRGGAAVAAARARLGLDSAPTISTKTPTAAPAGAPINAQGVPDPRLTNTFGAPTITANTRGLQAPGGGDLERQFQSLISGRLGGFSGAASLPELDARSLADLAAIRSAQEAQLEQTFGAERDQLLRQLFGSGVERSTIAGRAGEQLLGQRAQAGLELESQAGQRRLGLRQSLADLNLRQASTIAQGLSSFQDARSRVQAASIQGNAQVEAARLSSQAQLNIAGLQDATRRFLGLGELDFERESLPLRLQNQLDVAKIQAGKGKGSLLGRIFGGIASVIPGVGTIVNAIRGNRGGGQ